MSGVTCHVLNCFTKEQYDCYRDIVFQTCMCLSAHIFSQCVPLETSCVPPLGHAVSSTSSFDCLGNGCNNYTP